MDLYEALLRGGEIPRVVVPGGSTNGRVVTEYERPKYKQDKVPPRTAKYAEPFVEKLKDEVWKRFDGEVQVDRPDDSDIYGKYDFSERLSAPRLPIEDHEEEILETVRNNTVVVLRGPTGCGKTTKVPQFILDEYRRNGLYCNIAVAQPTRIAATSNAKRVCEERGWVCGTIVGYQVGSDHRGTCSADTRILFCTTGVLVESIIHNSSHNPLNRFTHIILDEVHARDKDMDFLMITIYKYLNPKIRVILMSATIDVEKFAKYYQIPSNSKEGKAPIIELGFKSNYKVTKVFLDDIENMDFVERMNLPEIDEQMYQTCLKLIVFFERIDRKHSLAEGVDIHTYESQPKPSVLVFLPGIFEIKQMYQRLEEWSLINGETKILRIVMHSSADPLLNELAMQESDKNTRKIILATNIAESSITVPNVKYVIDFCLSRNLVVNPVTKVPSLQLSWASHANCEQRAGRTGRVQNGWCYRLVSKRFYDEEMEPSAKPELVTSPLENIILKSKQLNLGSPEEVLALALDKPYLDGIHNAVLRLKEMGAMLTTTKGRIAPRDGDITYIGEIMSALPIDVKLSKLIALGCCFGIMEECIIIAAALNCSKNMFTSNLVHERGVEPGVEAYQKYLEFADGSGSDLFAVLNAYRHWKRLRVQGKFGNIDQYNEREAVRRAEKKWAHVNFLEIASLRECDECIKELRRRISRMNLIDCAKMDVKWSRNEKHIVLKVVIAGAFYPNYFSRSTKSKRNLEAERFKTIGGRDPGDTVYFTGFKPHDLPHICIKKFKDILLRNYVISERDMENVTVAHDGVAERVYVSFKNNGKEGDIQDYGVACQPGFVSTKVYKAIKLGMMKSTHPVEILLDRDIALRYARDRGLIYDRDEKVHMKDANEYENVCYPRKLDTFVKGYISHTESCSRFWFQPSKCMQKISDAYEELNHQNTSLKPFKQGSQVVVGQILAAVWSSEGGTEFYRAKVIFIERKKENKEALFEVRFIDFGNTQKCKLDELRRLSGVSSRFITLPPYCYPCSLACIQPSQMNCPDGVWRNEQNQKFIEKTDGIELTANIYSVVNGIVRVILFINERENLNQLLILERIAIHCEESLMSKHEHIERENARNEENTTNCLTQAVVRHLQEEDIPTIKPPTRKNGRMGTIKIKGPFTPLAISLYGLCNNSSGTPKIDSHSVNHVLLENEPNDMSEKYLVAVSANQNSEDSAITVRQTTIMPNIRLFGPLMAAIFAPKMKLERNKLGTHYIKMMTGLGCDDNGVCLSSETNMKFDLDAELKNSDIETVNSIRSAIDRLMSRKCFEKYPPEKVVKIIQNLQNDLISLLSPERLLLPEEYGTVSWGPYKNIDLASPKLRNRMLTPHQYLRLEAPRIDYLLEMEQHHKDLKLMNVNDDPTRRSQKCRICQVDIEEGIRIHLLSRQHRDGIKAINLALSHG